MRDKEADAVCFCSAGGGSVASATDREAATVAQLAITPIEPQSTSPSPPDRRGEPSSLHRSTTRPSEIKSTRPFLTIVTPPRVLQSCRSSSASCDRSKRKRPTKVFRTSVQDKCSAEHCDGSCCRGGERRHGGAGRLTKSSGSAVPGNGLFGEADGERCGRIEFLEGPGEGGCYM